jgi:hypothetical protein
MKSVRLQEAFALAQKFDSELQATGKWFKKTVVAVTNDGAVFVIPNSFTKKFKKYSEFTFIFSEHYEIIFLETDLIISLAE